MATAKRPLKAGEILDGEGGYTVWGKLYPAATSLAMGGLPIGLAHHLKLKADVAAGQPVCRHHVDLNADTEAVKLRHRMEQTAR